MARADFTGYTKRSRTVAIVVTGAVRVRVAAVCHMLAASPRATRTATSHPHSHESPAQPRAPKPRGTHMTSDKSPPATVTGLARTALTAMESASVIFGGPHAKGRTQTP